MRKTLLILILVTAAIILSSCERTVIENPVTINLDGSTKMRIALHVNPELGVHTGEVTISKGDMVYSQPLEFDNGNASVLFSDLQPGIWLVEVELRDEDDFVLYQGSGEAGVVGGQTNTATIVLEELSGDLEVVVEMPDGEPTTYIVHPEGTGDFATVQAAIDACEDGDIVELTDGLFKGAGNRNIDFLGKAITVRSQSGVPEACVIDCEQAGRGFYFHNDEETESRLEAITISNGVASDGGGIYCHYASPSITNCTFSYNHSSGGFGHGGGGMSCNHASPSITDCTFHNNTSLCDGAGMDCEYSSPIITGCTFIDNANGTHNGGGIRMINVDAVQISDCIFQGNTTGGSGGGIIIDAESTGFVTNCVFTNNSAGSGGGIVRLASFGDSNTDVNFNNCTITENEAELGGGIACWSASPRFVNCVIAGNTALNGGGIICRQYSNLPLPISPIFFGCTISHNSASNSAGGVACWDHATPTFERSIIALSTDGEAVSCADGTSVTLSCVDIYGNAGGDWVGCIAAQYGLDGNISEDPLFCDAAAGDYTIRAVSPCAPENSDGCKLIGALPVGCGE